MKISKLFPLIMIWASAANAQHPIDRFLTSQIKSTVVLSAADDLIAPQDLDFCRVPGREHELWVLNREMDEMGGSIVILYDAGKPAQWAEYRHDSHADHFMVNPTSIAMGANGNWANVAEILNTMGNHDVIFMGPTLWTSDTSIFARINQSEWDPNLPLGSHSDMLHESPFSMGIAADTGNVYWVFDGYNSAIFRYDFQHPHEYGGDDHSDGIIWKYDVSVKRKPDLPSHMVLDEESGWLYVVDNGNNRMFRMQTRSGIRGEELTTDNEPLADFAEMNGATFEVIESARTGMCGIDYSDGRLIVSNNINGQIRVYNTTTTTPTYLGSIMTGDDGIMGVKIGPDSVIWYVNREENTVVRLAPGAPLSVSSDEEFSKPRIYPTPATTSISIECSMTPLEVRIVNMLSSTVKLVNPGSTSLQIDISDLPAGVYFCQIMSEGSMTQQRFVVSR
jgi:hypothetical protein